MYGAVFSGSSMRFQLSTTVTMSTLAAGARRDDGSCLDSISAKFSEASSAMPLELAQVAWRWVKLRTWGATHVPVSIELPLHLLEPGIALGEPIKPAFPTHAGVTTGARVVLQRPVRLRPCCFPHEYCGSERRTAKPESTAADG